MSTESVTDSLIINRAELTGIVRQALECPGLHVQTWEAQPLHGGADRGSAVCRLRGRAQSQDGTIPWSLILKVFEPLPQASDLQGFRHFKREALAYQSGLLQRLPGQIRAPRCYGVQQQADGSVWLWLEDIDDEVGEVWTLAQYGQVARQLGRFNGAYLVGERLPSDPWVTRGWLRRYVELAAPGIDFMRHSAGHPLVRALFPGTILPHILALWDERERYLEALDHLPQVFCHQDAFRRNLFVRHDGTVAIDWGYAGIAPVGAELAPLVAATAGFFEVPPGGVAELGRVCFEGYLQGLRDAGWQGPERLVQLGNALSGHLRYLIGAAVGEVLPNLLRADESSHMRAIDRPDTEIVQAFAGLMAYSQAQFMEAVKLLGESA